MYVVSSQLLSSLAEIVILHPTGVCYFSRVYCGPLKELRVYVQMRIVSLVRWGYFTLFPSKECVRGRMELFIH